MLLNQQRRSAASIVIRIMSAALIFLFAIQFFGPGPGKRDQMIFDKQDLPKPVHIGRYLAHQAGLNAGKGFLKDNYGNSVTRTSPDDIGFFIWQANLKLYRMLFSSGPATLSYNDFINIRLFLVGAVLALMILLRFDVPSAIMSMTVMIFSGSWSQLGDTVVWPASLAIVIAFVLLKWLCISANRTEVTRWDYISLLLLATLGGIVSTFRAIGAMILKYPFWLILILVSISLVLRYYTQIKQSAKQFPILIKERFRSISWPKLSTSLQKETSQPGMARTFALTLMILIGLGLVAPSLQFLNITLYSALDRTNHYPKMGGRHIKWGPLYAGLGNIGKHELDPEWVNSIYHWYNKLYWNSENIFWSDSGVRLMTSKETGSFTGWNNQSENAAKKSYLRIAFYNLPLVSKLYFSRLLTFLTNFSMLILLAVAALMLVGFAAHKHQNKKTITGTIWLTGAIGIGLIGFFPILGNPALFIALTMCLAAMALFSFAFVFQLVNINEAFDKKSVVSFTRATQWLLVTLLVIGLLLMLRVSYIDHKRQKLMLELKKHDITLNQLFNQYPIDAVYAFNMLDTKDREKIADSVIGTDKSIRKDFLTVRAKDILFVAYKNNNIFALIKVNKFLNKGRAYVFPIQIKFKQNNYNMTTGVMAMPFIVEPGIWLMSFRMPKKYVNGAIIKAPQQFDDSVYTTPKTEK